MSDDKRDWVAEHEQPHTTAPDEHPDRHGEQAEQSAGVGGSGERPASAAQGELADELRSIRAVGEDRN